MKNLSIIILLLGAILYLEGCGYDNYEPPKSQLTGRIVYNDQPVMLKSRGVELQLYQDGYDFKNPIPIFVDQEGKFEATLFDGEYKLVTRDRNGPWVNTRDTTLVKVSGHTNIQFEVRPFFTISGANVTLNGNILQANCTIQKIVEESQLDYANLFINNTTFVDETIRAFVIPATNLQTGSVSFMLDISTLNEGQRNAINNMKAIFARIGVKAQGADQAIYSEVFRLK